MIDPTHIIYFEEDTVVERVETGKKSYPSRLATDRWEILDDAPARLEDGYTYIQFYEIPGFSVIARSEDVKDVQNIQKDQDTEVSFDGFDDSQQNLETYNSKQ
jgi:hypothetical protein